ncbi:unnamed protein product, partial [Pylaiella littoralis]
SQGGIRTTWSISGSGGGSVGVGGGGSQRGNGTTWPILGSGSRSSSNSSDGGMLDGSGNCRAGKHGSNRNDERNESLNLKITVAGGDKQSMNSPGWRAAAIVHPGISARTPVSVDPAAATAPFQSFETETSNGTSDDTGLSWRPAVIVHPHLSAKTPVGVGVTTVPASTTPFHSFYRRNLSGTTVDAVT